MLARMALDVRRDELEHVSGSARTESSRTNSAVSRIPTGAVRQQAIEHNIECIEIGRKLDSKALTVWIGDGSNFAGQSNFRHGARTLSRMDA